MKTMLLRLIRILNMKDRGFGKSAECFKQVLVVNERDKAAPYYLDKSVQYIVNRVSENWIKI